MRRTLLSGGRFFPEDPEVFAGLVDEIRNASQRWRDDRDNVGLASVIECALRENYSTANSPDSFVWEAAEIASGHICNFINYLGYDPRFSDERRTVPIWADGADRDAGAGRRSRVIFSPPEESDDAPELDEESRLYDVSFFLDDWLGALDAVVAEGLLLTGDAPDPERGRQLETILSGATSCAPLVEGE